MNDGNPKNIYAALQSHCCIEELPDVDFLKNDVKIGITTINEVKEKIPDTKLNLIGNKAISMYACADTYGSVVILEYEKNEDEIFCVKDVFWTADGYNPLPYLLPIDRQLIDSDYVLPSSTPGCTIM